MSLIECPGCLSKLRIPESSAPVQFNCPRCGERLEVDPTVKPGPSKKNPPRPARREAAPRPGRTRSVATSDSGSEPMQAAWEDGHGNRGSGNWLSSPLGQRLSIAFGIFGFSLLGLVCLTLALKSNGSASSDEVASTNTLPTTTSDSKVAPVQPATLPVLAQTPLQQTSPPQVPPNPVTGGPNGGGVVSHPPAVANPEKPVLPEAAVAAANGLGIESTSPVVVPGARPPLMEEFRPEESKAKPAETKEKPLPSWDATDQEKAVARNDVEGEGWDSGGVIPFRRNGMIVVGPPGCPVVVSGNQVWHKESQKLLTELDGEFEPRGHATLSPDGKLFASAMKSPNQEETDVGVWNTETGEQLFVAKGEPEAYSDAILLSNSRLFVGGRLSNVLRVWDCETREELKSISFEDSRFDEGSVALSQDGEFLALRSEDRMIVARTSTGRRASVLENPAPMPNELDGESLIIRDNKIVSSRRRSSDAVFVFAWMQSLAFSPDMEELAGVSTHPSPRVMCWNKKGRLVFDRPLYTERRAFWENTLQWFPDRTAWLIENEIFHRETGRIVMSVRGGFGSDLQMFVYDNDHLMGTFPDSPEDLKVRRIPWDQIRESVSAMKEGRDALFAPGTPVRIDVQLGDMQGAQHTAFNMIQEAMERRMARDEIPLAGETKAVFRVRFAEAAGDTLPIHELQSPFDFRGRDTGRTMTEVQGSMIVELLLAGRDEPVWREAVTAVSQRSFHEPITEESVRNSMLSMLQLQINDLDFPYFIPASDKLLALPVIIQ